MKLLADLFERTAARLSALAISLALCASSTTAVFAATSEQAPIKIGFITSLSGVGAVAGKQMLEGATLYLEQARHAMGGRRVELVVENDETNPAAGIAAMHKLAVDDKVSLVAGAYLSNIGLAIAPLGEKLEVPVVLTVASADDLTQRKRSPWVIRTGWSNTIILPFADYALKKLHYKKVVTLCMDYPFGWEMAGDFQRVFEDEGGKIVQKIWLPLGLTDFSGLLKQIRGDADAVFVCTIGPACTLVPKQYAELGQKLPLFGPGVSFDDPLLPEIGQYVKGSISALAYSLTLNTTANRRFVADYRRVYGQDPTQQAAHGYMCMMWINQAIDALKGNVSDKTKLLAALRKVDLKESPKGPARLDEYGGVVENLYVRRVDNVNGHFQNTVIETFPMVSQFWKYDPQTFMEQPVSNRDYPPCKYCQPEQQP